MPFAPRSRLRVFIGLGVVLVFGLGSRQHGMPRFSVLYLGDVLWGTLFFLLYALLLPRSARLTLWKCAVATTEGIELSQIYRAPWALRLRATALGGLLLGHEFSWSDTLCVLIGATLGAMLDWTSVLD